MLRGLTWPAGSQPPEALRSNSSSLKRDAVGDHADSMTPASICDWVTDSRNQRTPAFSTYLHSSPHQLAKPCRDISAERMSRWNFQNVSLNVWKCTIFEMHVFLQDAPHARLRTKLQGKRQQLRTTCRGSRGAARCGQVPFVQDSYGCK